jgi:transcriptional regulator with PAS, ATPase and Fis domain
MKVDLLYKHFMMTPSTHLPVISREESFVGLISKQKVIMDMADLSLQDVEYDQIPEHLMDYMIDEKIIYYFQNNRTIPVITLEGQKIGAWDKPRFLAEISKFTKQEPAEETNANVPTASNQVEETRADSQKTIYKFIEIILESFPDALFATDKEGETTFFNEHFESDILKLPLLKDSISYAERYFKELNRDIISNFFKSKDINDQGSIPTLQVYVKAIERLVRVITLRSENKVIGFLYHFVTTDASKVEELSGSKFLSIEKAFQKSLPLQELMEKVEIEYIQNTLTENQYNISQTAAKLKVPRSTLQNKIRHFKIKGVDTSTGAKKDKKNLDKNPTANDIMKSVDGGSISSKDEGVLPEDTPELATTTQNQLKYKNPKSRPETKLNHKRK